MSLFSCSSVFPLFLSFFFYSSNFFIFLFIVTVTCSELEQTAEMSESVENLFQRHRKQTIQVLAESLSPFPFSSWFYSSVLQFIFLIHLFICSILHPRYTATWNPMTISWHSAMTVYSTFRKVSLSILLRKSCKLVYRYFCSNISFIPCMLLPSSYQKNSLFFSSLLNINHNSTISIYFCIYVSMKRIDWTVCAAKYCSVQYIRGQADWERHVNQQGEKDFVGTYIYMYMCVCVCVCEWVCVCVCEWVCACVRVCHLSLSLLFSSLSLSLSLHPPSPSLLFSTLLFVSLIFRK